MAASEDAQQVEPAATAAQPAATAAAPADLGALAASLAGLGRSGATNLLHTFLCTSAADPATVAESLLEQPQSQLRSHGLLAALLAGRTDLLIWALKSDAYVWKAAACFLCQVRPGPHHMQSCVRVWVRCNW